MPLTRPLGESFREAGFKSSEEQKRLELGAQFDRVLKGKFDELRDTWGRGVFKSKLPGIDRIMVAVPIFKKKDEPLPRPNSANVTIFYETEEGERHADLSINGKGEMLGKLPLDLRDKLSTDDILAEILNNVEELDFNFWIPVDKKFLQPGEWSQGEKEEHREHKDKAVVDPERIPFLRNQPGAKFGFVSTLDGGFEGYHGVVFEGKEGWFAVLEHPTTENAAYFIDDIPPFEWRKDMTREKQKEVLLAQPWIEWLSKSKKMLRDHGSTYVVHRPGAWKEQIMEEIRKRQQ